MTKLFFLIPALGGGGVERVLVDIVSKLNPQKYDITVCTIYNEGIYRDRFPPHVTCKTFFKKPGWLTYRIFWRLVKYLPQKWIHNFFIKEKYDIEIAFCEGIPLQVISGRPKTVRTLTWVHADLYNCYHTQPLFRSLADQKNCYGRFERILCVSNNCKEMFVKRFGDFPSLRVIYNILDTDGILEKASLPSGIAKPDDGPVVCSVGRLAPEKGYARLLEIHKALLEEGLYHYLWLVGEGQERANLESFVRENNLSGTVRLWGFQTNPYAIMKQADLFVCSSLAEGYSLVVAEALLLSKPVISTNCAGPDELLANGEYGLLTENTKAALLQALRDVLQNPSLLEDLKTKAKRRSAFFAAQNTVEKIEELFDCP